MRARALWLITFPFLLAGETLGHALAARLFDSDNPRHQLLLHAAGDYRAYARAVLALALVLVFALLVQRLFDAVRGKGERPLPGWRLATIPAAAFLVQEHLERLLHDGDLGRLVATEPAVLAGMALQLPCGLFALWLVRALLLTVDQVGLALARRAAPPLRSVFEVLQRPVQASPLRPAALASHEAGRAPPVAA